ncbi:hypothetical protein Tco_0921104 [Tanacetum coccineum]
MANTSTPLLQELARAADSDDIRDQLLVLFTTESIEILKRVQLDDMEKASRLLLMVREIQSKVFEKNTFIARLRD